MKIRRFKNGDETKLFQVFLSAVHKIASRDYTLSQIEAWAPKDIAPELWAQRMQCLQPFVVEIGEHIVGYADIQANGYIDHFFVSGDYSRQGVGSLLMDYIHAEACIAGVSELSSDVSKTAEPFFLHYGFHVEQRNFPVRRGVVIENARMRKKLQYGA